MERSTRFSQGSLAGLLLGALLLLPAAATASDLLVLTEDNPPVSFQADGKPSGLACEIVQAIETRVGDDAAIHFVPWARGYKMAQEQPSVALFMTVRTPEREKLFKWVGPLSTGITSFYARSGSGIHIGSLDEARNAGRILVPREFYSHQFLRDHDFRNLDVVNTPEMMVRMLMAGRGTLMVANSNTVGTLMERAGASRGDVSPVYSFIYTEEYIAFSLQTPDAVVQSWQRALGDMKEDGSYARIHSKWLSGDAPTAAETRVGSGQNRR